MNQALNKIIILSGKRGIGKSTVCNQLSRIAHDSGVRCGGFISYKSADSGITIEDIETGKTAILASVKPEHKGPMVGQYYFSLEGLKFGLSAMERGLSSDLLFIDELGHLEVKGQGFAVVFDYLERGAFSHAVVVIREELLLTLLPRFKNPTTKIVVTAENRDNLATEVFLRLIEPCFKNY